MEGKEKALEALKKVIYPGFSKDIVTLGAIDEITVTPEVARIKLRPISADEAAIETMAKAIQTAVADVVDSDNIEVLVGKGGIQPPQQQPQGGGCGSAPQEGDPSVFQRDKLPGVKNIIPVISGKGGVGKSTVSVNLAFTLVSLGHKVGLLDLDIFGPSTHKMLGSTERLRAEGEFITPANVNGLMHVSIGNAVKDDEALVMRGPMVMKLLNQLLTQVTWGELDYLIVDMPPGTGDVPLSLVQQLDVTGAVVVTTPQDIALLDVRRAVTMFRSTETLILGLVENMSYYKCENCGDVAHIFGKDGGVKEATKLQLPLLGQIPLTKTICDEAEEGSPIFDRAKSPELAKVFVELANAVIAKVNAIPEKAPASVTEG